MTDWDELTDFPTGLTLSVFDWTVETNSDKVFETLTDEFGSPTIDTSTGVRWESTRSLGIYNETIAFDRSGSLFYSTSLSWGAVGAQFLGLFILLILQWVPSLSAPWSLYSIPILTKLQIVALRLFAAIALTAFLARLHRGPSFDPEALGIRSTRTGAAYNIIHDMLFVVAAGALGAGVAGSIGTIRMGAIGAVVFGLLALINLYSRDAGSLPLYDRSPEDGWITPSDRFTGQFKLGVIASLPPILSFLGWFVLFVFFDTAGKPFQSLVLLSSVPPLLTVGYCLLCFQVYGSYKGRRLDPDVTIGGRLFLLAALVLTNSVTAFVFYLSFFSIFHHFRPSLLYREIMLFPSGFLYVGATLVGCLGVVALTNAVRIELWERAEESQIATLARFVLTAISLISLIFLFGVLANFLGATISALMFGNDALLDSSPQTVRTTWEEYLWYTSVLPDRGYSLFRGSISTILWLPIVFFSTIWGAAIDRRIRHRIRLFRAPQRELDINTPVDQPTVTVVQGTTAYATGGLLTRSRIVIGDHLTDKLTDDQLAAIVAHERHHIENRDTLIASLAGVAGVVLGGANVMLAFIDLARQEYEADMHACRIVSSEALRNAVVQIQLLAGEDNQSNRSHGFVLGGDFALSATAKTKKSKRTNRAGSEGRIRRLLDWPYNAVRIPQELLFGDLFFEMAHPSFEVRLKHIELWERIPYLIADESTHQVTFPTEQTVTVPVSREWVLDHFNGEKIDRQFAEEIIDILVADGELIETDNGRLLKSTGGNDATT